MTGIYSGIIRGAISATPLLVRPSGKRAATQKTEEEENPSGVALKRKKQAPDEDSPDEEGVSLQRKTPASRQEGVSLVPKRDIPAEIDILINQDFYLPGYPKVALIRANTELSNATFSLIEKTSGQTLLTGNLQLYGKYLRWGDETFYFADFSQVNAQGAFRLVVEHAGGTTEAEVEIKASDLDTAIADAARYFYYQRCGVEVSGMHKACHLDDPQGTTGGWHDAGDYNKYIYTQWQPAWALLSLYEETQDAKYLEEARWGTEFLAKMVRGDGSMWSAVFGGWNWTRPEQDAPRQLSRAQWGNPSWAVATSSATFARMAKYSSGTERRKYLDLAIQTNRYYKQQLNPTNIPRGEDLQGLGGIVLSDLLLHELTNDSSYLESAERNIEYILAHQDERGFFFSDDNPNEPFWDDYMTYFFVEGMGQYAKQFPRKTLTSEIKASLRKLMEGHLKVLAYNTPYRQMQWLDPYDSHPANGEVYDNFYLKLIEGWVRGSNSYYLSSANTAMIAYSLLGEEKYKDLAINQLNWVLGINPYGISMMEGHCNNCTRHYHHRYDTIPGHETGAVPGGITSGIASNNGEEYFYDLAGSTWASNETWLPHNAWFIMLGLRLNDYVEEDASPAMLPVSSGTPRRTLAPPEPQITIIREIGAAPNVTHISTTRDGTFIDEGESIGVDIVLEIIDIPAEVTTLKSFVYTNQEYPQGTNNMVAGQTSYTFQAYLYKLNKFSGFFIRGYDASGNMVFQTAPFSVELPQE